MNKDFLEPWYALKTATEPQTVYNRPRSAATVYQPKPQPKKPAESASKVVYRPAMDVFMELTVTVRKDLDGSVPYEWPDDFYGPICTSWYEEQKKKGIRDIAFLIGDEVRQATGHMYGFCMVCWYADDGAMCFIPSQESVGGGIKPVIKEVDSSCRDYCKPDFPDNGESFKEALNEMADFAPFEGWKNRFKKGYLIMGNDDVTYCGQERTFPIPKPYFKYLLAAQATELGFGMGSWFDLPIAGTQSFKTITERFSIERCKALMFAINNC